MLPEPGLLLKEKEKVITWETERVMTSRIERDDKTLVGCAAIPLKLQRAWALQNHKAQLPSLALAAGVPSGVCLQQKDMKTRITHTVGQGYLQVPVRTPATLELCKCIDSAEDEEDEEDEKRNEGQSTSGAEQRTLVHNLLMKEMAHLGSATHLIVKGTKFQLLLTHTDGNEVCRGDISTTTINPFSSVSIFQRAEE
ncbi:hypothetical protein DUI87_17930 [Hirundo rustica rustica]|uniref:Uncharacterized protein n=1 Tax=Hirundo rustica rustica TaxID=333673 RepID=A0A3M0JV23_HIRRU|nr:hypothetical protein DUI87_17930 [Hirundo rustica rustica]